MHYLVVGAGQIGTQLVRELLASGHTVTVLRRGAGVVPGATVISGDAGHHATLRAAADGADAIFHCIHAVYSARAWRRELPWREVAVMDAAAELDIPVIFPESVYAFGLQARDLREGSPVAPISPLGRVRAELLEARAAHGARTASLVASDLVGPTASPGGSVILGTLLKPVASGRTAWVLGNPDVPHAVTYLPDLARAMIAAVPLAAQADTVLLAPTPPPVSQRQMARDAASALGHSRVRVRGIPTAALALGAPFMPTLRELWKQRYLWRAPSELHLGRLSLECGLEPTPWPQVLREWARAQGDSKAV